MRKHFFELSSTLTRIHARIKLQAQIMFVNVPICVCFVHLLLQTLMNVGNALLAVTIRVTIQWVITPAPVSLGFVYRPTVVNV